jgi:hypothetical protein
VQRKGCNKIKARPQPLIERLLESVRRRRAGDGDEMKLGKFLTNWVIEIEVYDLGVLFKEAPELEFVCYPAQTEKGIVFWFVCEKSTGLAIQLPINQKRHLKQTIKASIQKVYEHGIENLRSQVAVVLEKERTGVMR